MPSLDLFEDTARQLTVCNACRYCEGYCAVFPAIESRRTFEPSDIQYIANLCHDCRDCLYACQYAPPHEFAINIPSTLAQVREATYEQHRWPQQLGPLAGGVRPLFLLSAGALMLGMAAVAALEGVHALVSAHTAPGAFYSVIPAALMELLFIALGLLWIAAWGRSATSFWRSTAARSARASLPAVLRAAGDALTLTYLGGGGQGCTYPEESFSKTRRWLHHLVFYGFLLDLASTSLAAVYDHLLNLPAPYPLWSPVVVLGTIGGIGIVIGATGLLVQKARSDRSAAHLTMLRMDVAFLAALLLVATSGILLLGLRGTAAMGALLVLHLSTVLAFFLTAPYGKFVHLVYRYTALVRFAAEQRNQS